jgi:tyrosine-specific transport protein
MCELGAGGVSLTTMARRTLGPTGSNLASAAYVFLHYALLVAYISKAGEIVSELSGLSLLPSAAAFVAVFGGLCYFSSSKQMDTLNGGLVGLVVASFLVSVGAGLGLEGSAAGGGGVGGEAGD